MFCLEKLLQDQVNPEETLRPRLASPSEKPMWRDSTWQHLAAAEPSGQVSCWWSEGGSRLVSSLDIAAPSGAQTQEEEALWKLSHSRRNKFSYKQVACWSHHHEKSVGQEHRSISPYSVIHGTAPSFAVLLVMMLEGLLSITCKVLLQSNYKGGKKRFIASSLSPVVLKTFPKAPRCG